MSDLWRPRDPRAANLNQDLLAYYRGDYAWGRLYANLMTLPGLQLLILGRQTRIASSTAFMVPDLSPSQRHLSLNASGTLTSAVFQNGTLPEVPYLGFDGTMHLFRLDEPGLSITGALSMIVVFRVTSFAASSFPFLAGKFPAGGNGSYVLYTSQGSPNSIFFAVGDGTAAKIIGISGIVTGKWYLAQATYTPSTLCTLRVNGAYTSSNTAIPAALDDNALQFQVARWPSGHFPLTGDIALVVLCDAVLSDTLQLRILEQSAALFGIDPTVL